MENKSALFAVYLPPINLWSYRELQAVFGMRCPLVCLTRTQVYPKPEQTNKQTTTESASNSQMA